MEVLSSRLIHRCPDLEAAAGFWCDTMGLRVYREYGSGGVRSGVVLFAGGGLLELTSAASDATEAPTDRDGAALWLQVHDIDAEAARLTVAGVDVDGPRDEPWGLREAWLTDPAGLRVVLVEVPAHHPIRSRLEL